MRILVTNDDGVLAPGLQVLANALSAIAEVSVVAPDRDRSGASNSLTLVNPLRAKQQSNGFISVAGTPTDCVHLALTGLLAEPVNMVVSGINQGANLGDDTLYSGTVAAAMEGRFLGLPALAISLASEHGKESLHYLTAATVAKSLVLRLQVDSLPPYTILNVNVPDLPVEDLRGFDVVRLGRRHQSVATVPMLDPRGRPIYWIGPPGAEDDAGLGTDFYAIREQKVAITPLHLDMTSYKSFDQLSCWVESLQVEGLL